MLIQALTRRFKGSFLSRCCVSLNNLGLATIIVASARHEMLHGILQGDHFSGLQRQMHFLLCKQKDAAALNMSAYL